MLEAKQIEHMSPFSTSPMKLVVMTGHDLRALGRDMPELIDKRRSACCDRVSGGAS